MKVIEAYSERLVDVEPLKKIEVIARTCYKSEDKITSDSYHKMIHNLISRNHYAMIEHADIALECDIDFFGDIDTKNSQLHEMNQFSSYLRFSLDPHRKLLIISGNLRAWLEYAQCQLQAMNCGINEALLKIFGDKMYEDVFEQFAGAPSYKKGSCKLITNWKNYPEPIRLAHEKMTVKFVCDRGVSHELVRHRPCSFAQESTRYCNYSLGKYDHEITFIKPVFWPEGSYEYKRWYGACYFAEKQYFDLLDAGAQPQQARTVLPNSLKTEIFVTASMQEWRHIFALRACDATGPAHPQMKEVMVPLLQNVKSDASISDLFRDLESGVAK